MFIAEKIEELEIEQKKVKNSGATFKKVVFHIHTPASYDYGLKKKGDIKNISINDIKEMLIENGFPEAAFKVGTFEEFLIDENKIYSSQEESALYFLMAFVLLKKEIELAVVMDHHTFDGYKKLEHAIMKIYDEKNIETPKYTHLLPGIEISCSDKNHVAGIFKSIDDNLYKFNEVLNEVLVDQIAGTYEPAYHILQMIKKFNGIGYIAHIDQSDILKEKSLSGAYKKKLFNSSDDLLIGLSNTNKSDYMENKINEFRDTDVNVKFLWDEDSHTIVGLGNSPMWVKGKQIGFQMLINVLKDYESCILLSEPKRPSSYISSLYVEGNGFLSKNGNPLVFQFSDLMNAFIGGRGSGKSTVLTCLEFLTTQNAKSTSSLENIMNQGCVIVKYYHNGRVFFISSMGGKDLLNDIEFRTNHFDEKFAHKTKARLRYKRKQAIKDRIQMWEIINGNLQEVTKNKMRILDELFTSVFSIYDLVNSAEDKDSLNDFMSSLLNRHATIMNRPSLTKPKDFNLKWLVEKIKEIDFKLKIRKEKVLDFLTEINTENRIFQIEYQVLQGSSYEFPFHKLIYFSRDNAEKPYKNFGITNGQLIQYLRDQALEVGVWTLIKIIADLDYSNLPNDFSSYSMESIEITELNLLIIDQNKKKFMKELQRLIKINYGLIFTEINNYYQSVDQFTLKFNTNNKSNIGSKESIILFKDIVEVSMGQKVVALLNFVITFSEYLGDKMPLIIDQPEDHLDNQYIYNNLVQTFREIKGERQIIIASHNSTIVMNSGCEQVFVMKSNSEKGWLDKAGYSRDKPIKEEVINILEGGIEAFKKKLELYDEVF